MVDWTVSEVLLCRYWNMLYLAFLRGINVGGKNIIPMKELKAIFISCGFTKVETFIQSGNVKFDSREKEGPISIKAKIENALLKYFGSVVSVMVRRFEEIRKLVKENPFKDWKKDRDIKFYVCFLEKRPEPFPSLPWISEKEGLEFFRFSGREAFVISRRIKDRYGFPNNFLEKELNLSSTARNWLTIEKMIG
jgi:uncharacterized protein (DUF1697 family)